MVRVAKLIIGTRVCKLIIGQGMQKEKMRQRTKVHKAGDLSALHEDLGTEVTRLYLKITNAVLPKLIMTLTIFKITNAVLPKSPLIIAIDSPSRIWRHQWHFSRANCLLEGHVNYR